MLTIADGWRFAPVMETLVPTDRVRRAGAAGLRAALAAVAQVARSAVAGRDQQLDGSACRLPVVVGHLSLRQPDQRAR
jgi:hypothetical protein